MQTCPPLKNMALAAPGIAADKSASGKMMTGDFPPSSKVTRFRLPFDASRMARPVAVDPVKVILSTSICAASAAPASFP